jgi:hypothetical protein
MTADVTEQPRAAKPEEAMVGATEGVKEDALVIMAEELTVVAVMAVAVAAAEAVLAVLAVAVAGREAGAAATVAALMVDGM